ncbi:DUF4230 domain-containing protein [Vallitalea guaymasensis]|uniref:DUF4230 domain-containing protein n=1 Tax=Vallitalea guaymasensis TaxID=1185412 RepID=UPI000DE4B2D6|nr:DUF4230 domain-containing protein [Vallitalea guaymasensis]
MPTKSTKKPAKKANNSSKKTSTKSTTKSKKKPTKTIPKKSTAKKTTTKKTTTKKKATPKKTTKNKFSVKYLLAAVIPILVIAGIIIHLNYDYIKMKNDLDNVNKAVKIGELRTKEYYYQELLRIEDVRNYIFGFNSKEKLAIVFEGIIKAGYKTDNIEMKIKKNKSDVIVKLDDPQILSNTIVSENAVLDEKGLFADISNDMIQKEYKEVKEDTEKRVREGLLKDAKINGEKILTKIVKGANPNIQKVEFVYNEVD